MRNVANIKTRKPIEFLLTIADKIENGELEYRQHDPDRCLVRHSIHSALPRVNLNNYDAPKLFAVVFGVTVRDARSLWADHRWPERQRQALGLSWVGTPDYISAGANRLRHFVKMIQRRRDRQQAEQRHLYIQHSFAGAIGRVR